MAAAKAARATPASGQIWAGGKAVDVRKQQMRETKAGPGVAPSQAGVRARRSVTEQRSWSRAVTERRGSTLGRRTSRLDRIGGWQGRRTTRHDVEGGRRGAAG
jgi:hypothetical protein